MCSHSAGKLRVRADHVLAHVLGVRAGVADPLHAGHGVDAGEQLRERARRQAAPAEVAPVRVDVLAQQGHLGHAVGGEPLDLGHQLGRVARHLAPARRRDDAVGALHVAADADLHPALEVARPLRRKVAGEALELEVALRGQRVARQELGQLVHLPGPEGHVHERELAEHVVLDRLRPAAPDADHRAGAALLDRSRLAEMRDEALVGLLADRARVEQDQVRVRARRALRVAERLEHALHALGVVLVHLAPEGGDVVARHGAEG